MMLSRRLFPGLLALSMSLPPISAAGADPAADSGRVLRQGTVSRLDEQHSLAVERIERHEDGRLSARLSLLPEPGRAWTASAVYAPGQWLVAGAQCYQIAALQASHERERATVLLKGPQARPGCAIAAGAIPVIAGEEGTRIGEARVALAGVNSAAADGEGDTAEFVAWPSLYTLASAPAGEVRRQRLGPGQALSLDGRRYRVARLHAAGDGRAALAELEPIAD